MPMFFYDATFTVFFQWLGFEIPEIYAVGMAASLAAGASLVWPIWQATRNEVVRPADVAVSWFGVVSAFVAVAAVLQLASFPIAVSFSSYPLLRAALAVTWLLLLLNGVSAVWAMVGHGPEKAGRFGRFAKPLRYVGVALGIACVLLLGPSWAELSRLARM